MWLTSYSHNFPNFHSFYLEDYFSKTHTASKLLKKSEKTKSIKSKNVFLQNDFCTGGATTQLRMLWRERPLCSKAAASFKVEKGKRPSSRCIGRGRETAKRPLNLTYLLRAQIKVANQASKPLGHRILRRRPRRDVEQLLEISNDTTTMVTVTMGKARQLFRSL